MKTRYIAVVAVVIMLAAFALGAAGIVQLSAAAEEEAPAGRLIGVLITREYLDTAGAGQVAASASDEAGAKKYVFEGIDGIGFFTPEVADQSGPYQSLICDSAITDGRTNFNSTDEGQYITIEGTVYISTRAEDTCFYFNPVYQAPDGDVYAVSGEGMFLSGSGIAGESLSHALKESQTAGDGAASSGTDVRITVCCMDKPEQVSILQFDGAHNLLSQADYKPDEFPEALRAQPGAQYIIVETKGPSGENDENTARVIYQPKDEQLFAFSCREDGICVKRWCEVDWGN